MHSNGRKLIENGELKIENDMWGRREFNEELKMKNCRDMQMRVFLMAKKHVRGALVRG